MVVLGLLFALGVVATDTMNIGDNLHAPSQLTSGSGNVWLQIQGDGNLVIIESNAVLWASNTGSSGDIHLDMQSDGNLVLYGGNGVVWATNTTTGKELVMQNDCNLVLRDSINNPSWASNTACKAPPPAPGPAPPAPAPGPAPPAPTPPAPGTWGDAGQPFTIDGVGCNDDNIHQVPGHMDYFIGRIPINRDSSGKRIPSPGDFSCNNFDSWRLGLLKMDWASHKLSFVKILLDPNVKDDNAPKTPIQGGKYVLRSTYDATVAVLNGELWMSYECAGQGFGTASCMSPLKQTSDIEQTEADLSRTTIVVAGTNDVAASVPKIFTFKGEVIMYYDHFHTASPAEIIATGVYLQQESGGARRFWVKGHSDTVQVDESPGVAVWSPGGDGISNRIVDIFSVTPAAHKDGSGEFLIATAALGGDGCSGPANTPQGCYRMGMARSDSAMGENAYTLHLDGALLPGNTHEYSKVMVDDKGKWVLYANLLDSRGNPGIPFQKGFQAWPAPSDKAPSFFGL